MRKWLMAAGMLSVMAIPSVSYAQQGYEGLIAAPVTTGQSMQDQARQARETEDARIRQNNTEQMGRALAEAEERRKMAQSAIDDKHMVDVEQMNKAMEEAKRKQKELSDRAAQAERELSPVEDGKEWTPEQHKEYQKMLMDVTRQQQLLEEQAKRELEDAMRAGR